MLVLLSCSYLQYANCISGFICFFVTYVNYFLISFNYVSAGVSLYLYDVLLVVCSLLVLVLFTFLAFICYCICVCCYLAWSSCNIMNIWLYVSSIVGNLFGLHNCNICLNCSNISWSFLFLRCPKYPLRSARVACKWDAIQICWIPVVVSDGLKCSASDIECAPGLLSALQCAVCASH